MIFERSSSPRLSEPFNLSNIATEIKLIAQIINHHGTGPQLYSTIRLKSIYKYQQYFLILSTTILAIRDLAIINAILPRLFNTPSAVAGTMGLHGEPSLFLSFPAAHGLKADSFIFYSPNFDPEAITHALLVFFHVIQAEKRPQANTDMNIIKPILIDYGIYAGARRR